MITIGIDASSTCTGWSVFDNKNLIDYGAIKPKGSNYRERIFNEAPELIAVFNKYKPEMVYMEDVPHNPRGGISTAIILGAVQGFIYGVAMSCKTNITFVDPNTWRSDGGLFDGTQEGRRREVLKKKAIDMANKKFNLELKWYSPSSTKNDDDIAEAILICAVMNGIIEKKKKFGKNK